MEGFYATNAYTDRRDRQTDGHTNQKETTAFTVIDLFIHETRAVLKVEEKHIEHAFYHASTQAKRKNKENKAGYTAIQSRTVGQEQ